MDIANEDPEKTCNSIDNDYTDMQLLSLPGENSESKNATETEYNTDTVATEFEIEDLVLDDPIDEDSVENGSEIESEKPTVSEQLDADIKEDEEVEIGEVAQTQEIYLLPNEEQDIEMELAIDANEGTEEEIQDDMIVQEVNDEILEINENICEINQNENRSSDESETNVVSLNEDNDKKEGEEENSCNDLQNESTKEEESPKYTINVTLSTATVPNSTPIIKHVQPMIAGVSKLPSGSLVMKNNTGRIVYIQGADGKHVPIKVLNSPTVSPAHVIVNKKPSESISSASKQNVIYPKIISKRDTSDDSIVIKTQINKPDTPRTAISMAQAQKLGLIQSNKFQQVLNIPRNIKATNANIICKTLKVNPASPVAAHSIVNKAKPQISPSKFIIQQPTMVGSTLITKTVSTSPANKVMLPVKLTSSAAAEVSGANSCNIPVSQLQAINIPGKGVHYVRLINNTQIATSNRGPPRILNSLLTPVSSSELSATVASSPAAVASLSTGIAPATSEITVSSSIFQGKKYIVQKKPAPKQQFGLHKSGIVIKKLPTKSTVTPVVINKIVPPNDIKHVSRDSVGIPLISKRPLNSTPPPTKVIIIGKNEDDPTNITVTSKVSKLTTSQIYQLQAKMTSPSSKDPKIMTISGNVKHQTGMKKDNLHIENKTNNNKEPNDNLQRMDDDNSDDNMSPTEDNIKTTDENSKKRPCNCTKSQCLKLYCECFANADFCSNCNCKDCFNNPTNVKERHKAIRLCLERNPAAFKPKIGIVKDQDRKHTKGCNCKRSGCLKNYCECYEAKIICSGNCKCYGCKNTKEGLVGHIRDSDYMNGNLRFILPKPDSTTDNSEDKPSTSGLVRAPSSTKSICSTSSDVSSSSSSSRCSMKDENSSKRNKDGEKPPKSYNFMTPDVIEATVQCMIAQADECQKRGLTGNLSERMIIEEFGRCLVEIIEFSKQKDELE